MFKRKEEAYSIKEFMNRKTCHVAQFEFKEEIRESLGVLGGISLLPLATKPFFASKPVFAAEAVPVIASDVMYDKMLHAFDPLIALVQALAYPVAMVVVLGGALFIMIGNKEKGFSMMQGAGLGYVLVQMTPLVLNILVDAMKAI
jgi:hypothetical protein